jgi:ubiquinone/menaquinone biosynthesis C-methylase UbiE
MLDPDYEYRGLMAKSWDLLRGDTSRWADRFLYRELIEAYGQPVLDVGCGTGRLYLDYLQQGVDIDGMDNSPEMIELLHEKAQAMGLTPRVYQQTMETLHLPRRYRTILVPSSSFQLLVTRESARETMRRFYAHLEPGGALVMPFYINTEESPTGLVEMDWKMIQKAEDPEAGVTIQRWSRMTLDLVEKLEHTEDRYEVVKDGQVVYSETFARSPATRWYSQPESSALFTQAGFTVAQVLSEFSREPVKADDTLWTIVGVKPDL